MSAHVPGGIDGKYYLDLVGEGDEDIDRRGILLNQFRMDIYALLSPVSVRPAFLQNVQQNTS